MGRTEFEREVPSEQKHDKNNKGEDIQLHMLKYSRGKLAMPKSIYLHDAWDMRRALSSMYT